MILLFSTSTTPFIYIFFFFNDTATTEIYTLSLHDALPIWQGATRGSSLRFRRRSPARPPSRADRKSTRLNSSHSQISYAVFCLKKKKTRKAKDETQELNFKVPMSDTNLPTNPDVAANAEYG